MRENKKLKVAVIGSGMGRYGLLPAFLQDQRIEVVCVCTRRKKSADKFASQYYIPKAYDSWQELLQEEKLDLAAIAVPPEAQAEIARAFLQRKIPLFLEKQIALNFSQSQELCQLAVENGVPTCVNFIFPYLHTWRLFHSYLEKKSLGKIRQVFLNWRMESYDNRLRTANIWKTNDQQGGGVLHHFLSHSFYYLERFFGGIKELRCTLSAAPDLRPEGSAFASLDLIFGDQLMGHIAASNGAYSGTGHSLEIYGSEGSLFLVNESNDPVRGFKLYYASRSKGKELVAVEEDYFPSTLEDSRISPTAVLTSAFVDSLMGEPIKHPTIEDAHRVQRLLDLAIHANTTRSFMMV